MMRSTAGEEPRVGRASRRSFYALGVMTAVVIAILLGMLTAGPAQATTFTVNSIANPGDGTCNAKQCTLTEAVLRANANDQADTVVFESGLKGTIVLHNNPFQGGFSIYDDVAGQDLRIKGPGARILAVDGSDETRAFGIAPGAQATISGLTVTNGYIDGGSGGAITNGGTLRLDRVAITSSTAYGVGGGVYNTGLLQLTNSTISGNFTNFEGGGGVYNSRGASLAVVNSTLSGNRTNPTGIGDNDGGAIFNAGNAGIYNSTLSGNSAGENGGGIYNYSGGTASLYSTIVYGNSAAVTGPNVGGAFNSLGHNLIGDASGATGFVTSDQTYTDPLLGLFHNNGGPTNTYALLKGSPAINAVPNSNCPDKDQRGVIRPQGKRCDIGSYERKVLRR